MSTHLKGLVISVIISATLLCALTTIHFKADKKPFKELLPDSGIEYQTMVDSVLNRLILSEENVYWWLSLYDIPEEIQDVIVAQSIIETGNYKCNRCTLDNNNIFGIMKGKSYEKFDAWPLGIKRYKELFVDRYYGKQNSHKEYIKYLIRRNYAEDPSYGAKVLHKTNKLSLKISNAKHKN